MGYIWLVVKNNLEKYEFVNGKDDIPYIKLKKNNHQPGYKSLDVSLDFARVIHDSATNWFL